MTVIKNDLFKQIFKQKKLKHLMVSGSNMWAFIYLTSIYLRTLKLTSYHI